MANHSSTVKVPVKVTVKSLVTAGIKHVFKTILFFNVVTILIGKIKIDYAASLLCTEFLILFCGLGLYCTHLEAFNCYICNKLNLSDYVI